MRDIKQFLGQAIRSQRAEMSMSQEELAERAGLHRTYVSGVERGVRNPSLESIEKLAVALDLSVSSLFVRAGGGNASHMEILLVEDNLWDVEMTVSAFQRAGIENKLHVARDGAEALHFLFATEEYQDRADQPLPGVVLLDLNLPKVGGMEVLQQIRENPRTRNLPVVILTSSDENADDVACRRLGVDNYIVKPVGVREFIEATPRLQLKWRLMAT
jgi:CheY-like chemotaxis protein